MRRQIVAGLRVGDWLIVEVVQYSQKGGGTICDVRCTRCGGEWRRRVATSQLQRGRCRVCYLREDSGEYHRRANEQRRAALGIPWEVDSDTRFADDIDARAIVTHFGDGMTLNETGAAMGLSTERVRQIQARAIDKLRAQNIDLKELLIRPDVRCKSSAYLAIEEHSGASSAGVRTRSEPQVSVDDGRPWSEHGTRVDIATREMVTLADRAELASRALECNRPRAADTAGVVIEDE